MRSETVIVTRPQGDTFAQSLEARGFKTIIMPLFSLEPRELEPQDKVLLSDLKSYEWLIFTSQYGVRYAHQLLRDSLPITLRVAVIGKKTALAYTNYFNKNADFIGTGQSSEQFAEQFAAQLSPASRIILFTALEHRGVFTKIVQERGFVIEEFAIYQQVPLALNGEQIKLIKSEQRELLLWPFFSPSAVRACLQLGEDMQSLIRAGKIFSIGPVTTKALNEIGLAAVREPKCHTEEGMIALLCETSEI